MNDLMPVNDNRPATNTIDTPFGKLPEKIEAHTIPLHGYSPKTVATVLHYYVLEGNITAACNRAQWKRDEFYAAMTLSDQVREAYLRAGRIAAIAKFEHIAEKTEKLGIIVDSDDDPRVKYAHIQGFRAEMEAAKWYTSVLNREIFGDKREIKADIRQQSLSITIDGNADAARAGRSITDILDQ